MAYSAAVGRSAAHASRHGRGTPSPVPLQEFEGSSPVHCPPAAASQQDPADSPLLPGRLPAHSPATPQRDPLLQLPAKSARPASPANEQQAASFLCATAAPAALPHSSPSWAIRASPSQKPPRYPVLPQSRATPSGGPVFWQRSLVMRHGNCRLDTQTNTKTLLVHAEVC